MSCLSLLTNAVVVWNTGYMQEAITQLRADGYLARFEHINRLGKYSFAEPQTLLSKGLRQPGQTFAPAAATA